LTLSKIGEESNICRKKEKKVTYVAIYYQFDFYK